MKLVILDTKYFWFKTDRDASSCPLFGAVLFKNLTGQDWALKENCQPK